MRREAEIFLAILRSVLWGGSAELPQDVDWQSVLNLAARQKCLHAFSVWTKTYKIATPFDKQMQPAIFAVMARSVRLNHLAADVVALLAEHHIPAVLIKGYSLATLYPDSDTRDFGDVDIYVGEENYQRAAEIVTAAYPEAYWHSDLRGGIHYILVIDESQDRVVELHRVTMEFYDKKADALYQEFTRKHLTATDSTIDVYGKSVPVPSAAYNALYVFMHAWHHFESTGVGFRQLADWALCLRQAHQQSTAEEWQSLVQEIDTILTALHMKAAWQTFGHVLVSELHLPIEDFPLYTIDYQRRALRLLRQLLRDGHCGRTAKLCIKEIALMRRFPYERPAKHRVLQVGYTFYRLLFNAWQMGKFFPTLAWHNFTCALRQACSKQGK